MIRRDCGGRLKIAIPNVPDPFFLHSEKLIKFSLIHLPDRALVVSDTAMNAFVVTVIHQGLYRPCVLHLYLIKTGNSCIEGVWVVVLRASFQMHESCHTSLEFINQRLARFVRPSWVQVVLANISLATLRDRVLSGQLMLDAFHRVQEKLLLMRLNNLELVRRK